MHNPRQWFLAFLLIALGFGAGRWLNSIESFPTISRLRAFNPSPSARENITPRKANQSQNATQAAQVNPQVHSTSPPASLEDFLNSARGERLYNYLFDTQSLQSVSFSSLLKIIERRFNSPYPNPTGKHGDPQQQEIVARLGLLKVISLRYSWKNLNVSQKRDYIRFHKAVTTNANENLMVQVQAARNLRPWMSSLGHDRRIFEQKTISPHVLALASQSDRQLARGLEAHDD